jgi:hypothetical protein
MRASTCSTCKSPATPSVAGMVPVILLLRSERYCRGEVSVYTSGRVPTSPLLAAAAATAEVSTVAGSGSKISRSHEQTGCQPSAQPHSVASELAHKLWAQTLL